MQTIKDLIQKFSPISLDEMDSVKLMNRMDTKFAFSTKELEILLPKLEKHYRVAEINGLRLPTYKSLYFDDKDFSFYNAHHNGKTNRYKIRFRKYVESNLFFLEIKHKNKGRVNKKRIKVNDFELDLSEQSKEFLNINIKDLGTIAPTMWNVYNRITLVNQAFKERLTLDINLKFEWEGKSKSFNKLVIAELKQEKVNRNSPFFSIMKENGIRPYRISKYCIGTIELYSKKIIKYNRFKGKLLTLNKINKNAS